MCDRLGLSARKWILLECMRRAAKHEMLRSRIERERERGGRYKTAQDTCHEGGRRVYLLNSILAFTRVVSWHAKEDFKAYNECSARQRGTEKMKAKSSERVRACMYLWYKYIKQDGEAVEEALRRIKWIVRESRRARCEVNGAWRNDKFVGN